MTMRRFRIYCEIAVSKSVVGRAIKVSLMVGSALNLINQWESLSVFDFESLSLAKLFLTYFVPYGVTTYTATAMKVEFQVGTKAVMDVDLSCSVCGAEIHVERERLIPQCSTCGFDAKWRLR